MNKFGRVNSIYSYNKFKGGAYAAFFPLPEWFERVLERSTMERNIHDSSKIIQKYT